MAKFKTLRALSTHQRSCNLPDRGLRAFASLATLNNECTNCGATCQTSANKVLRGNGWLFGKPDAQLMCSITGYSESQL